MNWHNFPFVNVSVNQAFAEFTKQALVAVIYFVTLCFSSWVSNHLETVAQSSAIFLPAGVKLAFLLSSQLGFGQFFGLAQGFMLLISACFITMLGTSIYYMAFGKKLPT
ncbi:MULTISPECIES: hypothetical protein [Pseudoalteromonas]|uniref:Uncharacterized protein n=1 Tax=Pseudoalteromonas lipolytica TaxID=570156 RepID=A0ABU8SRS4_9GAMM|nr:MULTISPECIES: hypothetical protein [unclassified Pseudoalteromonas]